jgi:hypothetical protein
MVNPDVPRLVLEDNDRLESQSLIEDEVLERLLLEMQKLITRYPYVARSLAAAFVAEGQQFARTPEGKEWFDLLSQSELIRRGQLIWEAYGLDNLVESQPEELPGIWMDVFATSADHTDLESMLSMLLVRGVQDGSLRA